MKKPNYKWFAVKADSLPLLKTCCDKASIGKALIAALEYMKSMENAQDDPIMPDEIDMADNGFMVAFTIFKAEVDTTIDSVNQSIENGKKGAEVKAAKEAELKAKADDLMQEYPESDIGTMFS